MQTVGEEGKGKGMKKEKRNKPSRELRLHVRNTQSGKHTPRFCRPGGSDLTELVVVVVVVCLFLKKGKKRRRKEGRKKGRKRKI